VEKKGKEESQKKKKTGLLKDTRLGARLKFVPPKRGGVKGKYSQLSLRGTWNG